MPPLLQEARLVIDKCLSKLYSEMYLLRTVQVSISMRIRLCVSSPIVIIHRGLNQAKHDSWSRASIGPTQIRVDGRPTVVNLVGTRLQAGG